ncbi:beta transducin [Ascochyta lentis]
MAPKRTSLRPNYRNRAAFVKAAWADALHSKSESYSLRRLRNGLLDVTRRSGEYIEAIKTNSETPLLRLPPEVRNRVWEYALGGKVFNVVFLQTLRGQYVEEKTSISKDTFPENSQALLCVCRQIHQETVLLQFSANAFRFDMEEAFDWARHLLKVQRNLIEEVHVVTHRAERLYAWIRKTKQDCFMPHAFPIDIFPGLKRVVIEIHRSFLHDYTAAGNLTKEQYKALVKTGIRKITKYIKRAKSNVHITFTRTSSHDFENQ